MLTCQQEQQSLYRMISTFNLQANANGRLSAIRKLSLNLTAEAERMLIIRPGNRAIPSRTRIVHEWGSFLHQDRRGILGYDYIDFPMLGFLSLDFSDWCLGENEGLVVSKEFRSTQEGSQLIHCRYVRSSTSFERPKDSENWWSKVYAMRRVWLN